MASDAYELTRMAAVIGFRWAVGSGSSCPSSALMKYWRIDWILWLLFAAIVAILLFVASREPPGEVATAAPGASTRDAPESLHFEQQAYSVWFATNQHGSPSSTCERPMCRALLQAISRASRSIDFAIYGVRAQPEIVDALLAARLRGVTVRGVVDSENVSCSRFEYADTPELIARLGPEHVECDRSRDTMHNKFFVIDRSAVWTGSTNISDTELGGEQHAGVSVLLRSAALAEIYTTEFEEMFAGAFHRAKRDNTAHVLRNDGDAKQMRIESYFSPTDGATRAAVLPLIAAAEHTLDIAMFFFTSRPIANAIVAATQRGVTVRMILDATGAANKASQHRQLCQQGIAVKVEDWPGKSHSKWAVADAGRSSAAVVFGSMNWTKSGDDENDENTLYVKDEGFASAFHAEFARQWRDLERVPSCTEQNLEARGNR